MLRFVWRGKNKNVCDGALDSVVSGLKSREGPFVSFRKIFKFSKEIFEGCKLFRNFKNCRNCRNYKICERMCFSV